MKTYDSETKSKARKLIAKIIQDRSMLDIYTLVHKQYWKVLGFSSYEECLEQYDDLPTYTTIRKVYNAVKYQKTYLPDTTVGDLKEGVLRPIYKSNISKRIKIMVAKRIVSSGKALSAIKEKDVLRFIASPNLSKSDKEKALAFAQKLVTDNQLDEICEYVDSSEMDNERSEAFLKRIGINVRKILIEYV